MPARIALVDLAEGTVLAVRAALGAGAVRVCRRGAVPADVSLVILEASNETLSADGLPDDMPVLVLADWTSRPTATLSGRRFDILEKPFGSADLRDKARALLEPAAEDGKRYQVPFSWLTEPRVEAAVAATLAAAARLRGTAWLVGEPGTGTDDAAAALARVWDRRLPVVWEDGEPLAAAIARLDDAGRVLWTPAVDARSLADQKSLERFLALEPARRIVATGADDPEAAVSAGTLAHSLAAKLSRLSVRLAPLRERREEILAIAAAIAADVAGSAARVSFTDRAKETLQAYAWPHNLVELESVLTRSIAAAPVRSGSIELEDLLLAPMHLAPLFRDADGHAADDHAADDHAADGHAADDVREAPRRAVVVALGDVAAARAAAAAETTAASPTPAEDSAVESVLAGFEHDLRNPMSTIKTFIGLEAARGTGDSAELASLAAGALERVDEQLELLQRYSEITPGDAADLDLVDILGDAVDAADTTDLLAIEARRPLKVRGDADLVRFVADAVVAECRARRAADPNSEAANADIAEGAALVITIPTGGAAVDRLDRWVTGKRLPWRLGLAREAARRSGGTLDVEAEDGQLTVSWRLGPAENVSVKPAARRAPASQQGGGEAGGGEAKDDDQAGSPDRRRRSRSS